MTVTPERSSGRRGSLYPSLFPPVVTSVVREASESPRMSVATPLKESLHVAAETFEHLDVSDSDGNQCDVNDRKMEQQGWTSHILGRSPGITPRRKSSLNSVLTPSSSDSDAEDLTGEASKSDVIQLQGDMRLLQEEHISGGGLSSPSRSPITEKHVLHDDFSKHPEVLNVKPRFASDSAGQAPRPSILRAGRMEGGSVPRSRPSVSFAKRKEVVTFHPTEDRDSIEEDENDGEGAAADSRLRLFGCAGEPQILQVPLTPISEKNTESSCGDSCASPTAQADHLVGASEAVADRYSSGVRTEDLFLSRSYRTPTREGGQTELEAFLSTQELTGDSVRHAFGGISPFGTAQSENGCSGGGWGLPSIDDIARRSSQTPSRKLQRSSLFSTVHSPAPVYRFSRRLSLSSDTDCHHDSHSETVEEPGNPTNSSLEKTGARTSVVLSPSPAASERSLGALSGEAETTNYDPQSSFGKLEPRVSESHAVHERYTHESHKPGGSAPPLDRDSCYNSATQVKSKGEDCSDSGHLQEPRDLPKGVSNSKPLRSSERELLNTGTPPKRSSMCSVIPQVVAAERRGSAEKDALHDALVHLQEGNGTSPLNGERKRHSERPFYELLSPAVSDTSSFTMPASPPSVPPCPPPGSPVLPAKPQSGTSAGPGVRIPRISLKHVQNPCLTSAERRARPVPGPLNNSQTSSEDSDDEAKPQHQKNKLRASPQQQGRYYETEEAEFVSYSSFPSKENEAFSPTFKKSERADCPSIEQQSGAVDVAGCLVPSRIRSRSRTHLSAEVSHNNREAGAIATSFSTSVNADLSVDRRLLSNKMGLRNSALGLGGSLTSFNAGAECYPPQPYSVATPRCTLGVPAFTPRTEAFMSRRTVGPIKVSQGGIWERLENGASIITPRPKDFNPEEVRLRPSTLLPSSAPEVTRITQELGTAMQGTSSNEFFGPSALRIGEKLSCSDSFVSSTSTQVRTSLQDACPLRVSEVRRSQFGMSTLVEGEEEDEEENVPLQCQATTSEGVVALSCKRGLIGKPSSFSSVSLSGRSSSQSHNFDVQESSARELDVGREAASRSSLTTTGRYSGTGSADTLPPISLENMETPCRYGFDDEESESVREDGVSLDPPIQDKCQASYSTPPTSQLSPPDAMCSQKTKRESSLTVVHHAHVDTCNKTVIGITRSASSPSARKSSDNSGISSLNQKNGFFQGVFGAVEASQENILPQGSKGGRPSESFSRPTMRGAVTGAEAGGRANGAAPQKHGGECALRFSVIKRRRKDTLSSSISRSSSTREGTYSSPRFGHEEDSGAALQGTSNTVLAPTLEELALVSRTSALRVAKRTTDLLERTPVSQHRRLPSEVDDVKRTTSARRSFDFRLRSVLDVYQKFGLDCQVVAEEQRALLRRSLAGNKNFPSEEKLPPVSSLALRTSEKPCSYEPELALRKSLSSQATKTASSRVSQSLILRNTGASQNAIQTQNNPSAVAATTTHNAFNDEKSETQNLSPCFPASSPPEPPPLPSTGIDWDTFQAFQAPHLGQKTMAFTAPSLEELERRVERRPVAELQHSHQPLECTEEGLTPEGMALLIDWIEDRLKVVNTSDLNSATRPSVSTEAGISLAPLNAEADPLSCEPRVLDILEVLRKSIQKENKVAEPLDHHVQLLIKIFYARASLESWEEILGLLESSWPKRYALVQDQIRLFPKSLLSRRHLQLTLMCGGEGEGTGEMMEGKRAEDGNGGNANNYTLRKKLHLFISHLKERSELLSVLALGQWKLDITLPAQNGIVERLQATEGDLQRALQQAERLESYVQHLHAAALKSEAESMAVTKAEADLRQEQQTVMHQLREATALERKHKERTAARVQQRALASQRLQQAAEQTTKELSRYQKRVLHATKRLECQKATIQLSTLFKDHADCAQRAYGFRLCKINLDYIELELLPATSDGDVSLPTEKIFHTRDTDPLWIAYFKKWLCTEQSESSDHRNPEQSFEAWETFRSQLMDELRQLDNEKDLHDISQRRNACLQGLAAPPRPRICVLWRFEDWLEEDPVKRRSSGSCEKRLLEGLKVRLHSGVAENIADYLPIELLRLQPWYKSREAEHCGTTQHPSGANEPLDETFASTTLPLWTRRFQVETHDPFKVVTLGLAPVYLDWDLRRRLFDYSERQLNFQIKRALQPFNLPKLSRLDSLLRGEPEEAPPRRLSASQDNKENHSPTILGTPSTDSLPLDTFAPLCGTEPVLRCLTLSMLYCRSVVGLLTQQRELLAEYPPSGPAMGAESTYVPSGTPLRDYRLREPDIDVSLFAVSASTASGWIVESDDASAVYPCGCDAVFLARSSFFSASTSPRAPRRFPGDVVVFSVTLRNRNLETAQKAVAIPVQLGVTLVVRGVSSALGAPSTAHREASCRSDEQVMLMCGVLQCDVGMSVAFQSFLFGVVRQISGVVILEPGANAVPVSIMTPPEKHQYNAWCARIHNAYTTELDRLTQTSRVPQIDDLAQLVSEIEKAAGFKPATPLKISGTNMLPSVSASPRS